MTSFESDYNNGAHPEILRKFIETNAIQSASYGYDQWSESARDKIRKATQCPNAAIFFLAGRQVHAMHGHNSSWLQYPVQFLGNESEMGEKLNVILAVSKITIRIAVSVQA